MNKKKRLFLVLSSFLIVAVATAFNLYRNREGATKSSVEVHMRWFGMGGLFEVTGNGILGGTKETLSSQSDSMDGISFMGVYDPEVLRKMSKWESEGMTWVNWGEENKTCQNVIDEIEGDKDMEKDEPQLWQDSITLLQGKSGMFENMGPERFQKAIFEINKVTDISDKDKADADVYGQFMNWELEREGAAKSSIEEILFHKVGQEHTPSGYECYQYDRYVSEVWNLCVTEMDREFFKCLMTGTEAGYNKAFAINPYDLSDSMTTFMANYSCHLLELDKNIDSSKESEKRLMEFNNALLSSERYVYDEYGNVLSITYRDIYLEKMYAGTRTLMEGDAFILASMNPNDPEYSKLYEEYEKRLSMTSLWSTEQRIVQILGQTNEYEDQQCSIVNLTFKNGNPEMGLKHYSPWNGKMLTEEISTYIASTGSELGGNLDTEAMEKD